MTAAIGERPGWWNEVEPLIHQAARAMRRRYPQVEYEDLVSAGLEWCVKHPSARDRYLQDEDRKQGTRLLMSALRNAAKDLARQRKAELLGYDVADEAWYGIELLRELLGHIYNDDSWLNPPNPEPETKRTGGDPAEGNTWLATLADVSRAVGLLTPDQRWLIEAHFRDGWGYIRIGDELEPPVSSSTVGRRMDRAVRAVQGHLGGFRPHFDAHEDTWEQELDKDAYRALKRLQGGPGTRIVMSNAQAQYETRKQTGSG